MSRAAGVIQQPGAKESISYLSNAELKTPPAPPPPKTEVSRTGGGQKRISRATNWYIVPPCSCQNNRVMDCQSENCQIQTLQQTTQFNSK